MTTPFVRQRGMVSQHRKQPEAEASSPREWCPVPHTLSQGLRLHDLTQASRAGDVLAILQVRVQARRWEVMPGKEFSRGTRSPDPRPELGFTLPDSVPLQGSPHPRSSGVVHHDSGKPARAKLGSSQCGEGDREPSNGLPSWDERR